MLKHVIAALFASVSLAALHTNAVARDRTMSPCTYTDFLGRQVALKSCEVAIEKFDAGMTAGMIHGFTLANLCAIAGELRIAGLTPQEAMRCHRTGRLDPRTLLVVATNLQTLLHAEVDGWPKSSEFVEAVCLGVSKQLPHADRYAGFMFATGQGLPKNLFAALALLRRGKSRLTGQLDKLDDKEDRAFYRVLETQTQAIIDEIGDRSGPTPGPRDLDDLCMGAVREMKQRSNENIEKVGRLKIADASLD